VVCFWVLDLSILRGQNFFNYIPFLMIVNALNVPIGGVQVLFRRKKQWSFALDLACLEHLSVIIAIELQLMNN
jgi:hypothetical protein